ncbi:MAG TPA: hypothetical protein EYP31_06695 [Roseibacterium sp.]|nr:hypothetical protein [Roseibacterium sp.]
MNILLSYGADILVIFASLGAMAYCMILSRRLSRLTSFDKGLGGAIAVMSSQVDEMKAALREAKAGSDGAGNQLHNLVHQAREISSELEMMIAACHDFAEEAISVQAPTPDDLSGEPEDEEGLRADADADGGGDAADGSVTPIFGSRRVAVEEVEKPTPSGEPIFRHRQSAAI